MTIVPFLRRRPTRGWRLGAVSAVALLAACAAAGSPVPAGEPVPDPAALALRLRTETVSPEPRQATFQWTLDEAGSRVRGRGVARFVAPERIRLDLFGPRGETYLSAALVGEEFRVPAGAAQGVALPSPALLWSALGVLRPPAGAELLGATTTGDRYALRYALSGGETLEYVVGTTAPEPRIDRVQRLAADAVAETLRLDYASDGALSRVSYRDVAAYRHLTLDIEELRGADAFPDDIWRPDASLR